MKHIHIYVVYESIHPSVCPSIHPSVTQSVSQLAAWQSLLAACQMSDEAQHCLKFPSLHLVRGGMRPLGGMCPPTLANGRICKQYNSPCDRWIFEKHM